MDDLNTLGAAAVQQDAFDRWLRHQYPAPDVDWAPEASPFEAVDLVLVTAQGPVTGSQAWARLRQMFLSIAHSMHPAVHARCPTLEANLIDAAESLLPFEREARQREAAAAQNADTGEGMALQGPENEDDDPADDPDPDYDPNYWAGLRHTYHEQKALIARAIIVAAATNSVAETNVAAGQRLQALEARLEREPRCACGFPMSECCCDDPDKGETTAQAQAACAARRKAING